MEGSQWHCIVLESHMHPCGLWKACQLWVPWLGIILEPPITSLHKSFLTTLAFGFFLLVKEREETGKGAVLFFRDGQLIWPGRWHNSRAPTSQGQKWGLCVFWGHMGCSGPASEMWGPDAQGKRLEFTTTNDPEFSASERTSCSLGRDSKNTGWVAAAPDPKWTSFFFLCQILCCAVSCRWLRICCFLLESVAFSQPTSVLMPKCLSFPLGITSHLLPVQTVAEGWPHVPPSLKMGLQPTSSQSHFPSSGDGSRMRMQPKPDQRHLKPWLSWNPRKGETLSWKMDGEWFSA